MPVENLKDYIQAHVLQPQNNHKAMLKFTVLEHMEQKIQPEIQEVPHVWVGGRKKVKPTL